MPGELHQPLAVLASIEGQAVRGFLYQEPGSQGQAVPSRNG